MIFNCIFKSRKYFINFFFIIIKIYYKWYKQHVAIKQENHKNKK